MNNTAAFWISYWVPTRSLFRQWCTGDKAQFRLTATMWFCWMAGVKKFYSRVQQSVLIFGSAWHPHSTLESACPAINVRPSGFSLIDPCQSDPRCCSCFNSRLIAFDETILRFSVYPGVLNAAANASLFFSSLESMHYCHKLYITVLLSKIRPPQMCFRWV